MCAEARAMPHPGTKNLTISCCFPLSLRSIVELVGPGWRLLLYTSSCVFISIPCFCSPTAQPILALYELLRKQMQTEPPPTCTGSSSASSLFVLVLLWLQCQFSSSRLAPSLLPCERFPVSYIVASTTTVNGILLLHFLNRTTALTS